METRDRIIVALDTKDPDKALSLVYILGALVGGFKLGLEFFTSIFAQLVTMAADEISLAAFRGTIRALFSELQGKLFWDGKWNDIPNTVGGAASGIAPLKPKFINVHASAGIEAVKAAVANKGESKVLGVTVLTSINELDCPSIFGAEPSRVVQSFSLMLRDAKADGVICSPREIKWARKAVGDTMLIVTPGVRPEWAAAGDQKRIMTPGEAIKAGADYLVIGRPITAPPAEIGTSVDAAKKIAEEIDSAL